jgi:O-antigen ligase
MVDPTTSTIVATLSAIALLVLCNALRKTIARSEWDAAALLGALSVALFSLVYLVLTYSDAWVVVTKQYQDIALVPQWGRYAIVLIAVVLVVVSAAIVVRAVRRTPTLRKFEFDRVAMLLIGVLIVSGAASILNGDNPIRPASALLLAVLAACAVAPRGVGVHVGIAACCVIAAVASGFAIVVHKDFSVLPCVNDKCGVLGFNFRGIFHHENAFAMFLALAMPFVFIGFASWEGPVLSAYLLGLILIAGSRSASMAAVITLVVLFVVRPNIHRPTWAPRRAVLLYSLLAVAFVIGLAIPFTTHDPAFLNDRGRLWMMVKDGLSDPSTLFHGTGMLGWQHVRDAGLFHISAGYSVHNQYLDVMYTAGLVGLLLFVAALGVLIRQAGRTHSLVVGSVLLPIFILSVTERPWPVDGADWVLWIVPGALLSYPLVTRLPGDGTAEASSASEEPVEHSTAHPKGRHEDATKMDPSNPVDRPRGGGGRHRAPR